jgi:hypothetical protein
MPSDDSAETSVVASGDNGDRIFNVTHNDIDVSDIDVSCTDGSADIVLQERIWWSWVRRDSWSVEAGGRVNTTVPVDSSWYDADHRLRVFATANGTSCRVSFASTDE